MKYLTLKNSIRVFATLFVSLFIVSQTYISMAQTPLQPYRKVKDLDGMEIRFYPPAVEASVHKTGKYRQMMNGGFRDLASYIFGGNDQKQQIAMTAPVKSVPDASASESATISFIMPTDFKLENKPAPNAKHIVFTETKPVYTASLTFGGFASRSRMDKKAALLLEMVKKAGLVPEGSPSYLYYNPPFQLFGRRNEVLVTLAGFTE